jgi:hypothetical protein
VVADRRLQDGATFEVERARHARTILGPTLQDSSIRARFLSPQTPEEAKLLVAIIAAVPGRDGSAHAVCCIQQRDKWYAIDNGFKSKSPTDQSTLEQIEAPIIVFRLPKGVRPMGNTMTPMLCSVHHGKKTSLGATIGRAKEEVAAKDAMVERFKKEAAANCKRSKLPRMSKSF